MSKSRLQFSEEFDGDGEACADQCLECICLEASDFALLKRTKQNLQHWVGTRASPWYASNRLMAAFAAAA
jgi:hypothetical protein